MLQHECRLNFHPMAEHKPPPFIPGLSRVKKRPPWRELSSDRTVTHSHFTGANRRPLWRRCSGPLGPSQLGLQKVWMFWNSGSWTHKRKRERVRVSIPSVGSTGATRRPHRGGSRSRDPALYLQRLIHGSCYATHSKKPRVRLTSGWRLNSHEAADASASTRSELQRRRRRCHMITAADPV